MPIKIAYLKVLLILFVTACNILETAGQDLSGPDKELFDRGVSHFNKEEYQVGLSFFRELITKYSRDPVFNYFSGVSMTELNIDLETAIRQLKIASLKKVPRNVYFYLGKAHHLQEQFEEAINYYELFLTYGEKIEIKELETEKMISLCERRTVPSIWRNKSREIIAYEGKPHGQAPDDAGDMKDGEDVQKDKPGSFYDQLVNEAMAFQAQADSVRRLTGKRRDLLKGITEESEKPAIEKEILELEDLALSLQDEADSRYKKIRELEKTQIDIEFETASGKKPESENEHLPVMENLGNDPGVMVGKQMNDEQYFQQQLSNLLPVEDQPAIDGLSKINNQAIQFMKKAIQLQKEQDQEKLNASGAGSRRENKRALARIKELEDEIIGLKYEAIIKYQEVNDGVYKLFEDRILSFNDVALESNRKITAERYHQQARQSYQQALQLRNDVNEGLDPGKKFDKVAEANAYELMALENQKWTFATLSGMIPVEPLFSQLNSVSATFSDLDTAKQTNLPGQEDNAVKTNDEEQNKGVDQNDTTDIMNKEIPGTQIQNTGRQVETDEEESDNSEIFVEYSGVTNEVGLNTSSSPYSGLYPIPMNRILPGGVIYRIQVGVFRNKVQEDYFTNLWPITAESDAKQGFIRYYAGIFRNIAETEKALPEIRQRGFNDAFIVAHYQGRKISLSRAAELENINSGAASRSNEKPVYRLLLGLFDTPLSSEKLLSVQEKAGEYKIEHMKNNIGQYIYTIGNFINFEEAEAQRKILVNNGLVDLITLAYIGTRKVSTGEVR